MDDRCFDADDLGAVLARSDDPDVQAHLAACPACRTLLASYKAFLAGDVVGGSEVEAAARDLAQRIATLTGTGQAAPRPSARTAPRRGSLLASLPRPRLVGAALAASCVVVVASVVWLSRVPAPSGSGLLRGEQSLNLPATMTASRHDDGSVHLTWGAQREAQAYRVRLLAADLTPLLTIDTTADTTLCIPPATLDRIAVVGGGPRLWDVAPVVLGDVLAPTAPQALPLAR